MLLGSERVASLSRLKICLSRRRGPGETDLLSPEGDKLITNGAHHLHMSKKDLVEAAVAFYLDARREEMQAGMRQLLTELDGSRASRVAMLAGMTRAELDSVGGVE